MIKHLEFDDYGYIEGSAITNVYQTVLTLTDDADVLFIFNTCNNALILQVPSKISTKEIRLPAEASVTIDCRTNSKRIAKGAIKVKFVAAVTSGELSITAAR